jgi:hypothetical protein
MAVGLETRGRVIFSEPGHQGIELQAPLLEHEDAKKIIAEISEEKDGDKEINEDDIWKYSIDNLKGDLPIYPLVDNFPAGRRIITRVLREYEYDPEKRAPLIVVDGQGYVLLPSNGGSMPRRLCPVDDETAMPASEELAEISKIGDLHFGRRM